MTSEINKMKTKKKSFWLFLHPYVYVSVKKGNAIVYNTLNGELLEYNENENQIVKLIKKLNSDSHLYVVEIEKEEFDLHLDRFLRQLKASFSGDLIDTSIRPFRPIQMKPILSLHRKLDYLTEAGKKNRIMVNDKTKDYLSIISLYINGTCGQTCQMCQTAYKQFLCCFKNKNSKNEFNLEDFSLLSDEIIVNKLHKLNILGGNIFQHSNLIPLVRIFNSLSITKEYYLHYLNLEDYPEFFSLMQENVEKNRLTIIVHFPINEEKLNHSIDMLKNEAILYVKFCFVIENADDFARTKEIISIHKIKNFEFCPHYNGNNLGFFKKKLFITKDALIESKPGMKDIFSRMTFNTLEFKRLTILNSKEIFANLNNPKVGILGQDNLYEIIYRELHKGKSWTKVRKNVTPCKKCVFNALCPPISNYEYSIGQYNLCNINY